MSNFSKTLLVVGLTLMLGLGVCLNGQSASPDGRTQVLLERATPNQFIKEVIAFQRTLLYADKIYKEGMDREEFFDKMWAIPAKKGEEGGAPGWAHDLLDAIWDWCSGDEDGEESIIDMDEVEGTDVEDAILKKTKRMVVVVPTRLGVSEKAFKTEINIIASMNEYARKVYRKGMDKKEWMAQMCASPNSDIILYPGLPDRLRKLLNPWYPEPYPL